MALHHRQPGFWRVPAPVPLWLRGLGAVSAVLGAALIAALSLQPAGNAPPALLSDKAAHFAAYFALGGALRTALGFGRRPGRTPIAWGAATLYGLVLEGLQGWLTATRDASLLDALANWAGAGAGAGLAALVMGAVFVRAA